MHRIQDFLHCRQSLEKPFIENFDKDKSLCGEHQKIIHDLLLKSLFSSICTFHYTHLYERSTWVLKHLFNAFSPLSITLYSSLEYVMKISMYFFHINLLQENAKNCMWECDESLKSLDHTLFIVWQVLSWMSRRKTNMIVISQICFLL